MIRVYNNEITQATIAAAKVANKAIEDGRKAIILETPDMTACPSLEMQHAKALGWPEWLTTTDDEMHVSIDVKKIERVFRGIYAVDVEELTAEEIDAYKNQAREYRLAFIVCGQLNPDMPSYFVYSWKNGQMTVAFDEGEYYASRARQILKERIERGELPKPFEAFDLDAIF